MVSSPGTLPRGVWSPEANTLREISIEENTIANLLSPNHAFRRDVLAYCELRNLIPHPQLLPLHPNEEESKGAILDIGNLMTEIAAQCAMHFHFQRECVRSACLTWTGIPYLLQNVGSSDVTLSQQCDKVEDRNDILGMEENVGQEDLSEVYAQLLSGDSMLTYLSLRANGITSKGAAALANAVRINKKLESLNLFKNSIDDAGARAFAYALPFNTTLKTLSLANNEISGRGAKYLVDGLTKYPAPPELLANIEAAESQIHIQLDQAKKSKIKTDRATVLTSLGLPVLETIDGVQYAPGNATLEELLLSGNVEIGRDDVDLISEALEPFQPKLQTHLRCIKLQRLPKVHQHKTITILLALTW
ncbi:LRR-containing protein [Plasmopara halstedii]|uniref:LRR-containing protein n=1 Tax=Plasmopara halstedii TaxID=4781 RepID=A0A0P1AG30_PLAHL|nr:LRR-containing protein [Plasmopara halstedii]CEG39569.1 LRR-containing protein [Plasmopara halstedii]|eukprot:XP_024575938.1 LRR-containing protein [Plasmopara halstedii]